MKKFFKPILLLSFLFFSCSSLRVEKTFLPKEELFSFTPISGGIEYASFSSENGKVKMHAAKIDLRKGVKVITQKADDYSLSHGEFLIKGETVLSFAKRYKCLLSVNASPFTGGFTGKMKGNVGVIISDGKQISSAVSRYGAFVITKDDKAKIVPSQNKEAFSECILAVGGFFQVIHEGKLVGNFLCNRDSRVVIGTREDGNVVIVLVVEGEIFSGSAGLSFEESARVMQKLGAEEALELDGGGSATMVLQKENGKYSVISPSFRFFPLRKVASCIGFR